MLASYSRRQECVNGPWRTSLNLIFNWRERNECSFPKKIVAEDPRAMSARELEAIEPCGDFFQLDR